MKILLVALSKVQYLNHIELWERVGNQVVCVNTIDSALVEISKDGDGIDVVLIEPAMPIPFEDENQHIIMAAIPESLNHYKEDPKFWGTAFWITQLKGIENVLSFFLVMSIEEGDMVKGICAGEEINYLRVPEGPKDLLSSITAHAWFAN
jgi:hypothetical protein